MVEQIAWSSGKRKARLHSTDVSEIVAMPGSMPTPDRVGWFSVENRSRMVCESPQIGALSGLSRTSSRIHEIQQRLEMDACRAANGSGSIRISVKDRGLGIAGDELKRYSAVLSHEVVDSQISGNGLGLNLVQKIVDAHGGKVRVESKPGKGSTFTIELPVIKQ
jgi:light-regulated signal transduction histidine kinase (bacteriophytochrome)